MHVSSIVLINLVLQRQAVPEFMQSACTPEALAHALKPLLVDQQARETQLLDLDEANRAFGLGGESPSQRAARTVLTIARKQTAEPVPP
jgi:lipid-A-disaccharide synthase